MHTPLLSHVDMFPKPAFRQSLSRSQASQRFMFPELPQMLPALLPTQSALLMHSPQTFIVHTLPAAQSSLDAQSTHSPMLQTDPLGWPEQSPLAWQSAHA